MRKRVLEVLKSLMPMLFMICFLMMTLTSEAQDRMAKVTPAIRLIDEKKYEEALELAIEISKSDTTPVKGFGFQLMGDAYYGMEKDSLALFYFSKAEPLYPNAALFASKGKIFFKDYNIDSALNNYLNALQLIEPQTEPEVRFEILLNLGIISIDLEEPATAIQFLNQAAFFDPLSWEPYAHMADAFAQDYQFEQSLAYTDSARLRLGGDNPMVSFLTASGYYFTSKFQEAISLARPLLKDEEFGFRTHGLIGSIYDAQNILDSASYYFNKQIEMYPDDPESLNNLGYLYVRIGKYEEAQVLLERCIKLAPEFAYAYSNLASALLQLGLLEEALEYCNKSLALDDKNSYAYAYRANIYFAFGRLDEACADLKKAESSSYPFAEDLKEVQQACNK